MSQFEGWLHWQCWWVAVSLSGPGPPRRLEVVEICGNEELLPSWPFLDLDSRQILVLRILNYVRLVDESGPTSVPAMKRQEWLAL